MSEAGLPGVGLKLGAELLRSPNGVWYSATGADGATLGVLRFEQSLLKPAGAVERLIERVVAARAGMLPGSLPVVDLVEDAGRIWLITSRVPAAESAGRTEALLLGSSPVSAPGGAGAAGSPGGGANGYAAMGAGAGAGAAGAGAGAAPAPGAGGGPEGPWRPSVELTQTGQSVLPGRTGNFVPAGSGGPGGQGNPPQWTKKDLKDPLPRRMTRALVGLVLVAAVAGTATVVGLKMRDKKSTKPVHITGISVRNTNEVQPTGICNASVDMQAAFTTDGNSGTVRYQWEIPATNKTVQVVAGTQTISGKTPTVHLDWKLNLHGSGKVTAKFVILNPQDVLAPDTAASSSGDLTYQCP